jgi:hypothetical protein
VHCLVLAGRATPGIRRDNALLRARVAARRQRDPVRRREAEQDRQHGDRPARQLLIQEDTGANNHLGRIVAHRISGGTLGVVAKFDASLFGTGADANPNMLTVDEETSGIIDTEAFLGAGTFFFDAQVHTKKGLPTGTGAGTIQEFVERGQY